MPFLIDLLSILEKCAGVEVGIGNPATGKSF
jgi:hypothetical protein